MTADSFATTDDLGRRCGSSEKEKSGALLISREVRRQGNTREKGEGTKGENYHEPLKAQQNNGGSDWGAN